MSVLATADGLDRGVGSLRRARAAPASPSGRRLTVGIAGVLIAVTTAAINDHATDIAIFDIQGGLLLGHDEASWFRALFQGGQVVGMAFAPWCAGTFSLRRFCLVMTAAMMLLAILCPLAPNVTALYLMRGLQGLAGGFLPPLLITVALRFCPPPIRMLAFAGYALSATFGPNMALPLAAWSYEHAGWPALFWQIVPLSLISLVAVGYGIPQDPLRLERFRTFDWVGLFTGAPSIAALTIAVHQGDRLNWLASPLFSLLAIGGGALFGLFLLNEWYHPAPIFKLRMLLRRNVAHSLVSIATLLIVFVAALAIPLYFMGTVKGYRPGDVAPIGLVIALPQLILLPLVAILLDLEPIDSRYVFIVGLSLVAWSCYLGTHVTPDWVAHDFYLMGGLLAVGEPMCLVSILMTVTFRVTPDEGPNLSAMFNSIKGFAAVLATTLIEGFGRLRLQYHSAISTGRLGAEPAATQDRLDTFDRSLTSIVGDGQVRSAVSLHRLGRQIFIQDYTLAMADCYRVIMLAALALILLTLLMGVRVWPPRMAAR